MEEKRELPDVGHVGYIVHSLEDNIEWYKKTFGIESFLVYDFKPLRAWVNGEEIHDCRFRIGMGVMANGKKIEFIQPLSGSTTPHAIFLREKGANIHHVAFHVKDYSGWLQHFRERLGAKIIFEAEAEDEVIGYRRSFYAQLGEAVGIVEISEIPSKRKKGQSS